MAAGPSAVSGPFPSMPAGPLPASAAQVTCGDRPCAPAGWWMLAWGPCPDIPTVVGASPVAVP